MPNVINATSTGNGGLVSTGDDSGILNIQTNETTAITVDASQNVGIGTTSPGGWGTDSRLEAKTAAGNAVSGYATGAGDGLRSRIDSTSGRLAAFYYTTTTVGSITTNGTITVYGGTSDYRLKTVIGSVTGHGERIDALEPIEYTWNSNGSHSRGFLAHKFQEVYANSVSGEKDALDKNGSPEYQSMQAGSSEVMADLIAEIQSLRKRLATIETKSDTQAETINALTARIVALEGQ